MKKIIIMLLLNGVFNLCALADTHKMFGEFQESITIINNELSAKKISIAQANVLLSGIQARQNQVLIHQNNELLEQLKKLNKQMKK